MEMGNDKRFNIGEIGEIDYAILRSVSCRIDTIPLLNMILQIRTVILEKHLYLLTRGELLNFQSGHFKITERGANTIDIEVPKDIENIDKIKKIDEFIVSTVEKQKKERIKTYKIIDISLIIITIVLIILILYLGRELLM